MDNFDKYYQMRDEGYNPQEVYLSALDDNLNTVACIRMLNNVFSLSITEAKEVTIIARKLGTSLNDYQEKFVPVLNELFDKYGHILERGVLNEDDFEEDSEVGTKPQ